LLTPQERAAQLFGAGTTHGWGIGAVVSLRRGLAGLGVHRAVVALMQPPGKQPVQVRKRRTRAPATSPGDLDLDQELVAAGTVPPFDLSPALRLPANRRSCMYVWDVLSWGASGTALELAEVFFVAADFGGEGFEGGAELVDLDGESGEGERLAFVLAVFLDDGA